MLSRGYTSDFLLMMVMRARGANYPCSHPRASAAMATANTPLKKIARNWMSWTFRDKITDFVTRLATTARQRRDNFKKKVASPSQAKNRSCSRGFRTGSWFAFVAHWYWRSFSSSGKKNKQKTKTEMNLNPLRDEWLNAAEDFMYREDGIWFSRRQDLWDKIRSLLSFHSPDLKRHFPPTIFNTLRLILECRSEHMNARYSHLFPSMSTHWFRQ